jgi:hypothetical protein
MKQKLKKQENLYVHEILDASSETPFLNQDNRNIGLGVCQLSNANSLQFLRKIFVFAESAQKIEATFNDRHELHALVDQHKASKI